MTNTIYPANIQNDLDMGFIKDHGTSLRWFTKSDTLFVFREEINGKTIQKTINTSEMDYENTITSYWGASGCLDQNLCYEKFKDEEGSNIHLTVAKCEFELWKLFTDQYTM